MSRSKLRSFRAGGGWGACTHMQEYMGAYVELGTGLGDRSLEEETHLLMEAMSGV